VNAAGLTCARIFSGSIATRWPSNRASVFFFCAVNAGTIASTAAKKIANAWAGILVLLIEVFPVIFYLRLLISLPGLSADSSVRS
jgi:hypothetical protein